MKNHTIQFSPFYFSFLYFSSKYFPQHSVLKQRQVASDYRGGKCEEYRLLGLPKMLKENNNSVYGLTFSQKLRFVPILITSYKIQSRHSTYSY
jgi:hypothetical protein